MKFLLFSLLGAIFLSIGPCDDNPFFPKYKTIYECSFESPADTTGWQGISPEMFVNDPAPGYGDKSLYIGGGCLQPAALIILDTLASSGYYRLSCWGKQGEAGGNVKLAIVQDHEYVDEFEFYINSEEWKCYQKENFLKSSPNAQLRLELWVGGIIYNSMFMDGLKVEVKQ